MINQKVKVSKKQRDNTKWLDDLINKLNSNIKKQVADHD